MRFLVAILFLLLHNSLQSAGSGFSALSHVRHQEFKEHIEKKEKKEKKYLFDDWGGVREWLHKRGIISTASYVNDALGNPRGGLSQGFTQTGSLGIDFHFDLKKIWGWKGAEFYISALWRSGTSLSKKFIGNQFPVQQVYGGQTVRLNDVYFKQVLLDGKIMFKFGRLDAGNNFLQNPLYYKYVSNAFCGNPISVFFNFPAFTAYPNPTWAAYLQVKPTKRVLIKYAVYNGNNKIFKNAYHGLNFTTTNNFGTQYITEWSYLRNNEKDDKGLPGHYRVGLMYQTGKVNRLLGGKFRGNFFYYIHMDQTLYREEEREITPFGVVLIAPKDRNTFPVFFTAGLVNKGLIPGRKDDFITFGVAYGSYSSDLPDTPMGKQNFEMVIELNYWWQATKWFTLVPDFQYIKNPRGFNKIPSAYCFGAQLVLDF